MAGEIQCFIDWGMRRDFHRENGDFLGSVYQIMYSVIFRPDYENDKADTDSIIDGVLSPTSNHRRVATFLDFDKQHRIINIRTVDCVLS